MITRKQIPFLILSILAIFVFSSETIANTNQPIEVSLLLRDNQDYRTLRGNITSDPNVWLHIENKTGQNVTAMKVTDDGNKLNLLPWIEVDWGFHHGWGTIEEWWFQPPDGQKTIYVRVRTEDGQVHTVGETFIYDTTAPEVTFSLDTKTVGPDTMYLTATIKGQDKHFIHDFDYRLNNSHQGLIDTAWKPYQTDKIQIPVMDDFTRYSHGEHRTIFLQVKDPVYNISPVYTDSYIIDRIPPILYLYAEPSDSLSSKIHIFAYDELSELGKIQISNDPLFYDGVKEMPYQQAVVWDFDERRVAWVKVWDSVGNASVEHPVDLPPLNVDDHDYTPQPDPDPITPPPGREDDPRFIEFQDKIKTLQEGQDELKETVQEQEERVSLLESIVISILEFMRSIFTFWK